MLQLLGVRDDLLVHELVHGGDDLGLDVGQAGGLGKFGHAEIRSNTAARPWPPPIHMVSSPYRASRSSSSRARVASIRPPVALTGCPSEMPDPRTLVRSRSASVNRHSRMHASAWAANASLSSMTSIWERVRPALANARSVAGTGPIP